MLPDQILDTRPTYTTASQPVAPRIWRIHRAIAHHALACKLNMPRVLSIQLSLASGHSDWPCEKEESDLVCELYTILSKFSRGKGQINHRVYRLVTWFGKHVKNSKGGSSRGFNKYRVSGGRSPPAPGGSSWYQLAQVGTSWCLLERAGTNQYQLMCLGSNWY